MRPKSLKLDTIPAFDSDERRSSEMAARYARAAALTAPKLAATIPGIAVDGYWLDKTTFFFLAERMDPRLGRIMSYPTLAHCAENSFGEVIPLETLAALLTEKRGEAVGLEALSSASFDMLNRDLLGVSVGNYDYLVDVRERSVIEAEASSACPALYSPNQKYACFVRADNVWLRDRRTGVERELTQDGTTNYAYGQQPETSLAAVSYRKSPSLMGLWSSNSEWLLTHRIDERSVPELALVQHVPPTGGRPVLHRYKYAMPGDELPVTHIVAIHIPSGRLIEFEQFGAPTLGWSPFLWHTVWFGSGNAAYFVRVDRYFQQAELIRLDLESGVGRIVLRESTEDGYIDLHPILTVLPNIRMLERSKEVIWFSERDGFGHLYLYDVETGNLKNRITHGEWLVRDIVHVDESKREILFLAGGLDPAADPAQRSLCSIKFDGSGFERLCSHEGDIFVARTEPLPQDRPFCPSYAQPGVSPGEYYAVVRYSSVERGNFTRVLNLSTRQEFLLASAKPAPGDITPQRFTALAADNLTLLHGVLFFPSDFDETRCYPLIDFIYPGPQIAQQPQFFGSSTAAFARALAELGFVTMMLDTRGMPFRSRRVHQMGYGKLLEPQLSDHAAVVSGLAKRFSFIDADRIGIVGYSGGGFATARALCDYSHLFNVGVAACGNHDSRFYASLWSDKYRGRSEGRGDWADQATAAVAHKLKGKLLLISGDMDENVHVSQTLALVDALIRKNRIFDLLIVPNEGHLLLMTNGYVQRRVWDYFVQHLLGESPPVEFEIRFEPHELARSERNWRRAYLQ